MNAPTPSTEPNSACNQEFIERTPVIHIVCLGAPAEHWLPENPPIPNPAAGRTAVHHL